MNEVLLSSEDIDLLVSEIEKFAQKSIQPLVERPERLILNSDLDQIIKQVEALGILGEELFISTRFITSIARVNAGVALHLYQLSLSRLLIQQLGFAELIPDEEKSNVAFSLFGFYGLGGQALANYLANSFDNENSISTEDIEFLRAWFEGEKFEGGRLEEKGTPFVFHGQSSWQYLIHPRIDSHGELVFSLYRRENLAIEEHENSHGLDEVPTFSCQNFIGIEPLISSSLGPQKTQGIYNKALQLNALAYMAIALGAIEHGYQIASAYAGIRSQGGHLINQHSAVKLLLAKQKIVIDQASLSLNQLAQSSVSNLKGKWDVGKIFSLRASLQPDFCEAANAAMQTCGGIGYMQDMGLEKIVRDCNTLRVMDGSPVALSLFVASYTLAQESCYV